MDSVPLLPLSLPWFIPKVVSNSLPSSWVQGFRQPITHSELRFHPNRLTHNTHDSTVAWTLTVIVLLRVYVFMNVRENICVHLYVINSYEYGYKFCDSHSIIKNQSQCLSLAWPRTVHSWSKNSKTKLYLLVWLELLQNQFLHVSSWLYVGWDQNGWCACYCD